MKKIKKDSKEYWMEQALIWKHTAGLWKNQYAELTAIVDDVLKKKKKKKENPKLGY